MRVGLKAPSEFSNGGYLPRITERNLFLRPARYSLPEVDGNFSLSLLEVCAKFLKKSVVISSCFCNIPSFVD